MPDLDPPRPSVPESRAVPRKHTRLSIVWVIPILAAVVGAWVAATRVMGEGPKITIVFRTADGLQSGKTKINYRGVDIGTVTKIRLSDDHQHVIATAQMAPHTDEFLADDTQFWVVRPRVSGSTVTGLGTIISGAYIGLQIGSSKQYKSDFVALETPPVVTGDRPGRLFVLKTRDLGSLDLGTPVYFRRLPVGQVVSYDLDKDGEMLTVKVFIRAPYDQYVNAETRFWHASGFDLSLSASGLKVQTQSVLSILIGGIAFETAANAAIVPPSEPNSIFTLFGNRAEAFEPAARNPQTYQLIFNESVRGLVPGAPVEFRGIPIGEVVEVRAHMDLRTFKFSVPVTIHLDPQRLGVDIINSAPGLSLEIMRRKLIDSMVAHGVRAQLRTGNLLTGAVYVALDVFPGASPQTVDWSLKPPRLPTTAGQLEATEATVESIIEKVNKMPLQQIGDNLNKALASLDLTLISARGTIDSTNNLVGNANHLVGSGSTQTEQLGNTLREVSRAARSVRVLADYLERHPEALLRGKQGEAK